MFIKSPYFVVRKLGLLLNLQILVSYVHTELMEEFIIGFFVVCSVHNENTDYNCKQTLKDNSTRLFLISSRLFQLRESHSIPLRSSPPNNI